MKSASSQSTHTQPVLSKHAFLSADTRTVVLHSPARMTKADLLAMSNGLADTAYRLYATCDAETSPETVLCNDLFEMPVNRRFPELADDKPQLGGA